MHTRTVLLESRLAAVTTSISQWVLDTPPPCVQMSVASMALPEARAVLSYDLAPGANKERWAVCDVSMAICLSVCLFVCTYICVYVHICSLAR